MRLLDDIQAAYPSFNKVRKRIADIVLSDPAKCSFLPIRDFAALAGTTDVTVIAFCKALGFQSYSEFRKELQSYVLERSTASSRMMILASTSESVPEFFKSISEGEIQGVEEAFRNNPPEKLMRVNELIRNAQGIFIAAHNASMQAAFYLSYRYSTLGVDMRILNLGEVHQTMSLLSSVDPTTSLLVSISTPPYGKSTRALTELCKKKGMKIAALTDYDGSPLVSFADEALICPTSMQFGALAISYVPFMAIIEALAFFYYYGRDDAEGEKPISQAEEEYFDILGKLS